MKKKVFFILSSLGAGGAERVFWLLSQGFNKELFDVSIVLLSSSKKCFSTDIENVKIVELRTEKASRSFFKLYRLFKTEKPDAVYSTVDHVNTLVSLVSVFVSVPTLIARASNIPSQIKKYRGGKAGFYSFFSKFCYSRFNTVVCQSDEMEESVRLEFNINPQKIRVIPNPVISTNFHGKSDNLSSEKKLVIVARFSAEKGHGRLLKILSELPVNYSLTIIGDGPLKNDIIDTVKRLGLENRVYILGQKTDVASVIATNDLFVLSSFTEGFPNVVLEALSVGVPVVTFRVGGMSKIIKDNFNGYLVEQGDIGDFKEKILIACNREWNHESIRDDIYEKCALEKIVGKYQDLISHKLESALALERL